MLVMALEDYDEVTGKAAKARSCSRTWWARAADYHRRLRRGRLAGQPRPYRRHRSGLISRLYGKPEEVVVAELGDLIYRDPESKSWQTADAYLSGNVRDKLKAAEVAGDEYARNAVALRSVQPEDVLPAISTQPRCPVDSGQRHPGIRGHAVWRHAIRHLYWPFEERRRLERRGRARRRGVGSRHRRIRYGQGQRHLAVRAGAQHEDAGDLRHIKDRMASSGWSTRRRRWPPAKSRSGSRKLSNPGFSASRSVPKHWFDYIMTPTIICGPAVRRQPFGFSRPEPGDFLTRSPEGRGVAGMSTATRCWPMPSVPARRSPWPPPA